MLSSSSILYDYLNDFYNNPSKTEEYKINFLKNHYYPTINLILNCKFKNFKIGIKRDFKYRNELWFINKNNPNYEIIYNTKNDDYYIKNNNVIKKVNINDYKIYNFNNDNDNDNDNINNNKKRKFYTYDDYYDDDIPFLKKKINSCCSIL